MLSYKIILAQYKYIHEDLNHEWTEIRDGILSTSYHEHQGHEMSYMQSVLIKELVHLHFRVQTECQWQCIGVAINSGLLQNCYLWISIP